MDQTDIVEELKPYEAEVNAAIMNKDMAALRRIVEAAGLSWVECCPNEKYMFEDKSLLQQ